MVIGFVNAGLMSLLQATGAIMGANIGTQQQHRLNSRMYSFYTFAGMLMTVFVKKKIAG